eukprot:GEMP01075610.1.p1 GENE.GEMP01075610.1~~GEMP01075610.1.p1  ORF type:complete len:243 (+),score=45.79 GEMP01075610.1:186-914(+)
MAESSEAKRPKGNDTKLLIVGNSFVYYNNFVHILRDLSPGNLKICCVVQGVKGLIDHAADFVDVLAAYNPDAVVLQDYSGTPAGFHPFEETLGARKKATIECFIDVYAPALRKWHTPGRFVVFMNLWAPPKAILPLLYAPVTGLFESEEAMLAKVEDGHAEYKCTLEKHVPGLEVRIAKIGRAFAKSEFGEKLFALEDDIGHPSPLGSLLEACTVALELWGKTKKLAYANVVLRDQGGLNQK